MYKVGNSVEQVYGGSVIKQGDRTPFGFVFRDEAGETVSIKNATVKIKIANGKALLLEKNAVLKDDYTVEFSLGQADITGSGDMRLEFTVTYSSGLQEKFPSDDWQRIKITPTLDDITQTGIAYLTFEKMKADFTKKVDDLNKRVDELVAEAGNSNPEIMEAREDLLGNDYPTLQARINAEQGKINVLNTINGVPLEARQGNDTDDTERFRRAIAIANAIRSEVKLALGEYIISGTLQVTNNKGYGCKIVGINDEGVKIKTRLSGTTPLFSYKGGSGIFSNVGLKNMTIIPDVGFEYGGTALYIDGQCNASFDHVHINKLNYGIWLHNNTAGSFSEINKFDFIDIKDCNNLIRMEQGAGDPSFHGNDFTNVYLNINDGQIGFNHVSGYYYNGRLDLFMWAHGANAVYINANANAEHLVGNITYESFGSPGQLTGTGKFWVSGFLRGIGGFTDNTVDRSDGSEVFGFTNYWKSRLYGTTGFEARSLQEKSKKVNGSDGFFYRFVKSNVESILLNTFDGSNENGLYLGRTGYQKNVSQGNLGLFISSMGHVIKSFFTNGLTIRTADDQDAITFKDGRFTGNPGKRQKVTVNANAGAQQTFTLTGYSDKNIAYLAFLRVTGSNFENRRTFIVNNQGFGAAGSATQLSTHYQLNATGVSVDSVTVDSNGNLVVVVTTDRNLTIEFSAMGIGSF